MGKHRKRHTARKLVIAGVLAAAALTGFVVSSRASAPPVVHHSVPAVPSPAPMPKFTPVPATKPSGPQSYKVKQGDSLWSIAAAHCGTGQDYLYLQHYNKIGNPGSIWAGEVIKIAC